MTFRSKILAILVVVGVVPTLVLGWFSYTTSRQELHGVVGRMQSLSAHELARHCEKLVTHGVANLQLAVSYIPFDQLGSSELGAVLAIPYRQLPFVNVIALLDAKGDALAEPVFERPATGARLGDHDTVSDADLDAFAHRIPLQAALDTGVAVGPPYRGAAASKVAVALRIEGKPQRVLAAELSLREMQLRVDELALSGDVAYVVDASGVPLVHSSSNVELSADERALLRDGLGGNRPLVRAVDRHDQAPWLAAFSPVGQLGWGIVVAQPSAVAFRGADRVQRFTFLWAALALAISVVIGALLARGLSRPIGKLSVAAKDVTAGSYDRGVDAEGNDEIGQFARAFNHMLGEIRRRDSEIRAFNQELQQRVDERTAELRDAQDQIMRTRRLAGLASLGAGVAHELNNPMTAIMGLVTLVRKEVGERSSPGETLGLVLEQAKRVAKIASDLREFTDQEREGQGRRFAIAGPIEQAFKQLEQPLAARRIAVELSLPADLPEIQGNPTQIQQLVGHLAQNAVDAMPQGGRIDVTVRALEGEVLRLSIADTGKGIAKNIRERIFDPFFSTKNSTSQVGMGLAICHNIVEAHHGKISVDSNEGHGAIFHVVLPVAAQAGHLY